MCKYLLYLLVIEILELKRKLSEFLKVNYYVDIYVQWFT